MARHVFTQEDSIRGARSSALSRKQILSVERAKIKALKKSSEMEVFSTLATNPAVIGTALYLGIHAINSHGQPTSSSTNAILPQPLQSILGQIGQIIPGVGGQPLGGNVGNLGLDALEAAILLYIASGGNLAGVLQQSGNFLTKLIPSATAGLVP